VQTKQQLGSFRLQKGAVYGVAAFLERVWWCTLRAVIAGAEETLCVLFRVIAMSKSCLCLLVSPNSWLQRKHYSRLVRKMIVVESVMIIWNVRPHYKFPNNFNQNTPCRLEFAVCMG
jgi:hypothetical protein